MRNVKAIVVLALAMLAGLSAALYAAVWVSDSGRVATAKVVVAAADIDPGSKLNPEMLTVVAWPAGSLPAGAYTDTRQLQDRVLRSSLSRGEAVLSRKLMPAGAQGGLSAVIAEGKRAMTVRVNDVVGVAGFALPGNYVDVMVNAQQDRGKDQAPVPVSMTVLDNVLVLAVAQEANRDETKPKVVSAVTLELSLEEAERLDLARSIGSLSLVLRNQLDKRRAVTTGVSKDSLFRMREPAPTPVAVATVAPAPAAPSHVRATGAARAPAERPARPCVEVIRAGTRSVDCF